MTKPVDEPLPNDVPRGHISLEDASRIAQECEEKLTELYGRLRASGHAYAYSAAYEASETTHVLVQELSEAREVRS